MKNTRVIVITGDHPRHTFFRYKFEKSNKIEVIKSYCEKSLEQYVDFKEDYDDLQKLHFLERFRVENDFFSEVIQSCPELSKPAYIQPKEINNSAIVEEICKLNPDLIITYGCSIIKQPLITSFPNRIINVHLGLSPYYFGSGTNFWPLVNNEPEYVGYTLMYMDEGIDTGEIIHQRRAEVHPFDSIHQIGNRLIKDMSNDFVKLIENFDKIEKKRPVSDAVGKTYKMKEVTTEIISKLYHNFHSNMCIEYLKNKEERDSQVPLVEQNFLQENSL